MNHLFDEGTANGADGFGLATLIAKTGVAAPTIHQYRRLGLLPEPIRARSNRYVYDDRHVRALLIIRRLRDERHLSLDVIGRVLPTLVASGLDGSEGAAWDEQVEAVLREIDPARAPARLLAVARDAFAAAGYDAVSVGDICLEAGIAKGSFYRYFSSKEDAFLVAARSIVDAVADELANRRQPLRELDRIRVLGEILAPMAPLFLEVVLRALHGAEGHAEVVSEIISGIGRHAVHPEGVDPADAELEGERVTEAALAALLRARFDLEA